MFEGNVRVPAGAAYWRDHPFVGVAGHGGACRLHSFVLADRLPGAGGVQRSERARLTVTFGVATFAASTSLEACIKAADEALYRGKASGRNRVVSDISQLV